uniref:Uncharacterized protein n=1 Tax=Myoviridae sp. ctBtT5 TaxID=2825048 RepID=A0A8S5PY40_9CAUD|nr:MAG TPA: hypothetical protein [Myoviridae sp. ctBtT5]
MLSFRSCSSFNHCSILINDSPGFVYDPIFITIVVLDRHFFIDLSSDLIFPSICEVFIGSSFCYCIRTSRICFDLNIG